MNFFLSVLYFIWFVFVAAYLRRPEFKLFSFQRRFAIFCFVCHFLATVISLSQNDVFFPVNPAQSNLLITGVLGLVAVFLSNRKNNLSLLVVLLPVSSALLLLFQFYSPPGSTAPVPSVWLWSHILLMVLGEALFLLSALFSLVYLFVDSRIRQSSGLKVLSFIPSLETVDRFIGELVLVGFFLLSFGMLLGFFFAKQYWQGGWWTDPKVVFCWMTWVIYGLIVLLRVTRRGFRGRPTAWLACIGFVSVLFVSWGVESFFSSQHMNYKGSVGSEGRP